MESGTGADELGAAYERSLARERRKVDGVFYTPPGLARDVVEATLGGLAGERVAGVRVVDPACGGGALLVAAYRWLLARHAERGGRLDEAGRRGLLVRSIFGVDIDAAAVAVTRAALAEVAGAGVDLAANVRVGDALREEERGAFEVVLANPPYLSAETMARHHGELRAYCQARYAAAAGNWDLYCVFIERCVELCAPGGRCGLIVPNKLLSADYARGARGLLVRAAAVRSIQVLDGEELFAADVYPVAVVAERGAVQGEVVVVRAAATERLAAAAFTEPARPWVLCAGAAARVVERMRAIGRPLGELAAIRGAATVAEAYAIAGLIREGDAGLRVVNSGTIDAYEHAWGRKRLRYLGATYSRPVIPEEAADALPAKRLADARTPKVIVAGLTRTLEAVLDREGTLLAAKSTTIVTATALDLRVIVALLNSSVVRWYYRQVFRGDRLAGGYLRIGPPQLRQLPVVVPADPRLYGLVEAMCARPGAGLAAAIDAVVAAAYGLEAEDVAAVADDAA